MGYEIDPDVIHLGEGTLSETKGAYGCHEVEVGKTYSQKAVWMSISDEDKAINDEIVKDRTDEQERQVKRFDDPNIKGNFTKG